MSALSSLLRRGASSSSSSSLLRAPAVLSRWGAMRSFAKPVGRPGAVPAPTLSTYKPPVPAQPPPAADKKLVVLFPRQGHRKTSLEVKRRVLRFAPHMGGKRLKRMVRLHARKGNFNSFLGDLESRLDRFLYRANLMPSTFAARMACGHGHVLVNGRRVVSTHTLLKPGDIVEPHPNSRHIFHRFAKRRLANNTFVLARGGGGDGGGARDRSRMQRPASPVRPKEVVADFDGLLRDGGLLASSYARLPPPKDTTACAEVAGSASGAGRLHQSQLDALVPALVAGLAGEGSGLAQSLERHRGELSVRAPPQAADDAAPPVTLAWHPQGADETARAVATLDRVALRRLMLGILALRPAPPSM